MQNAALNSLVCLLLLAGCGGELASEVTSAPPPQQKSQTQWTSVDDFESAAVKRDVPYVPTPQATVDEMLRLAKVDKDDIVYDLGSGDGRIVITAAQKHRARGVGIDIDPQRVREANENAQKAKVTDRVRFIEGDLFQADLREATAVTLYLLPAVNLRLRPKLLDELKPGTPVVSHDFSMKEWEPDYQTVVNGDNLFLWIIPSKAKGRWSWMEEGTTRTANLTQEFQKLKGSVDDGTQPLAVREGRLNGNEISFELVGPDGTVRRYEGKVADGRISGTMEHGGRRTEWSARHE